MAELVPADAVPATERGLLAPLTDPAGGPALTRLRAFSGQPAVRRMLPMFGGAAAVGLAALAWATLSPAPQHVLYSQLDDAERASVVEALDKAAIPYVIDNQSGALTVNEDDLYRARMLVAADGAIAQPESGADMLDSLPMGASRTLEGERLRTAREHDLMMTIQQIDGVESVRVHLAEAEKSVFVRDNVAPSASIMVRMARGRQLSDSQVAAIVNLVSASVPGLSVDAVRVVDQHGRLLSDRDTADSDRLELQARMEEKLRSQVSALLTPVLGEGNFTSEIQIDLDMDEVTSARESYDKDGVVRSETQAQASTTAPGQAQGVPGVLSNTPPPAATPQPGAPQPGPAQGTQPAAGQTPPVNGEASSTRTYELGREVKVANQGPGRVRRVSVAVAISGAAMKNARQADIDQVRQLVSAAVGADPQRGDQVAVVVRKFEPASADAPPFYEAPWFAMVLRNAVALIAVLLVVFLALRPAIRAFKGVAAPAPAITEAAAAEEPLAFEEVVTDPETGQIDPEALNRQVHFAQRLVAEKPDAAVHALRQMLNNGEEAAAA